MRNEEDYETAARLVAELERRGVDLTAGYDNWMRVGASLSTLGEAGRELFHRVSRLGAGYRQGECDRKFDNLRRTTRRITLGTFVEMCRRAGVTVSRVSTTRQAARHYGGERSRRLALASPLSRPSDVASPPQPSPQPPQSPQPSAVSYHDTELVGRTLGRYEGMRLYRFLVAHYGEQARQVIERVFDAYKVGTTRDGGTIYWQHDLEGRPRAGKIMRYLDDGHRDRGSGATWVHSRLRIEGFELSQVPFGTHLLPTVGTRSGVCVVESEKTALIAMMHLNPRLTPEAPLFIATGGLSQLNERMLEPCRGRDLVIFPDRDGLEAWRDSASRLSGRFVSVRCKALGETAAPLGDKADFADLLLSRPLQPS